MLLGESSKKNKISVMVGMMLCLVNINSFKYLMLISISLFTDQKTETNREVKI